MTMSKRGERRLRAYDHTYQRLVLLHRPGHLLSNARLRALLREATPHASVCASLR